MDLGRANYFTHKIHLKDNNPVICKQFKIPEAHENFIEATLDEWLKLGMLHAAVQIHSTTHHCFVCPRNKARVSGLSKISVNSIITYILTSTV
jgi:hypothetical protein